MNILLWIIVGLLILTFFANLKENSKNEDNSTNFVKTYPLRSDIGVTEAMCPYCNCDLEKFPGRKIKCKSCGNYIYVRTRPFDRKRILIREDEIDLINLEYGKLNGSYEYQLKELEKKKLLKQKMEQKLGRELTGTEQEQALLLNNLLSAKRHKNWADYKDYLFNLAILMHSMDKYKKSLLYFLENAYFSVCGTFYVDDKQVFYSRESALSNNTYSISNLMADCIELLKYDISDVEKLFYEIKFPQTADFPLTKNEAWDKIETELYKTL